MTFLSIVYIVSFGISGNPLDWLRSFLSVIYPALFSGLLRFVGLPQGIVLGPLLYIFILVICYCPGLLWCSNQPCADDIQSHLHCPASDALTAVAALGNWMSSNHLFFAWQLHVIQSSVLCLAIACHPIICSLSLPKLNLYGWVINGQHLRNNRAISVDASYFVFSSSVQHVNGCILWPMFGNKRKYNTIRVVNI